MRIRKIISVSLFLGLLSPILASCSSKIEDVLYLRVYNAGDYVYENDPDNGYEEDDLTVQYVDWINKKENKEKYFGEGFNKRIEIIYDTYDTNETMYNELLTGKSNYNLVCTSDYMIQKLAQRKMIKRIEKNKVMNYETYASSFLKGENGKLNQLSISENDQSLGTLDDYSVGYMWGTMGLMFNPSFKRIKNRTKEQVIEDFTIGDVWSVLWDKNEHYSGCASIKDSIRDTYAMGIAYALRNENGENVFKELYEEYKGNYNAEYTEKLLKEFNKCDDETIKTVEKALIELKNYIYGFEVDTGKSDIVTQKVGVNLCWSGDAVYSMDVAEEQGVELYYTIPQYVCNIRFDGFCLMEGLEIEEENAAYSFLDFISLPSVATMNMDYVGYTSFIGGNEVFELINEWYDAGGEEETYAYDLSYFFRKDQNDKNDYVINVTPDQLNRQMRAQYPLESDLPHLTIMRDFGVQNDKIVEMWENVKVNPLPIWVTIVVVGSFLGIIGFLGSYKIINRIKLQRRRNLRNK